MAPPVAFTSGPAGRMRDLACAAVLMVLGLGAVLEGRQHRLGTLTQMQAGYFPIILGVILVVLGVIMLLQAMLGRREPGVAGVIPPLAASSMDGSIPPDWRGIAAIIGGVASFVALGAWFGLAPATFACVFISALGDRTSTLRGALILACVLTAVAAGLFVYALGVQFPILQWPG